MIEETKRRDKLHQMTGNFLYWKNTFMILMKQKNCWVLIMTLEKICFPYSQVLMEQNFIITHYMTLSIISYTNKINLDLLHSRCGFFHWNSLMHLRYHAIDVDVTECKTIRKITIAFYSIFNSKHLMITWLIMKEIDVIFIIFILSYQI